MDFWTSIQKRKKEDGLPSSKPWRCQSSISLMTAVKIHDRCSVESEPVPEGSPKIIPMIIPMSRILMSAGRWWQLLLISGTHLPQLRLVSGPRPLFRRALFLRPTHAFGKVTVVATSLRNFNGGISAPAGCSIPTQFLFFHKLPAWTISNRPAGN